MELTDPNIPYVLDAYGTNRYRVEMIRNVLDGKESRPAPKTIEELYEYMNSIAAPTTENHTIIRFDPDNVPLSGLTVYNVSTKTTLDLFALGEKVSFMTVCACVAAMDAPMFRVLLEREPAVREWTKANWTTLYGLIEPGQNARLHTMYEMLQLLGDAADIDIHGRPWYSTRLLFQWMSRQPDWIDTDHNEATIDRILADGADVAGAHRHKMYDVTRFVQAVCTHATYMGWNPMPWGARAFWLRRGLFVPEFTNGLWSSGQHPVLKAQTALVDAAPEWLTPDAVADLGRCIVVPPRKSGAECATDSAPGSERAKKRRT